MSDFQKIRIDGSEYYIVDAIQDLRAEDSFIHPQNKLKMYGGSGEARKYIGSYHPDNVATLSEFFEYGDWGDTLEGGDRTYPVIQENNCFISKLNLEKYLVAAKVEYEKQEQLYTKDISSFYAKRLNEVDSLNHENIFFSINDVSDLTDSKRYRAYIRSDNPVWTLLRKLILPKISYLSILKLIPVDASRKSQGPLFSFRVLLDYQFRSIVHPKLLSSQKDQQIPMPSEQPNKPVKESTARQGQEKYRREVIDHMAQCPFTKITDERLLIASHIKPYNVCIKESNTLEALDYRNGLALTPTYDKLFDQGYITFTDEGKLICGTLLTPYTWDKLNINPNAKNKMKIFPESREKYLKFHRQFVFQDDVSDLT